MHACSTPLAVRPLAAAQPTPSKSWHVTSPCEAGMRERPRAPALLVCLDANPLSASSFVAQTGNGIQSAWLVLWCQCHDIPRRAQSHRWAVVHASVAGGILAPLRKSPCAAPGWSMGARTPSLAGGDLAIVGF